MTDQPESGPRRALYATHQNQGKVTRMIAQIVAELGAGGILTVEESPRLAEAKARIAELERIGHDCTLEWNQQLTTAEARAGAAERELEGWKEIERISGRTRREIYGMSNQLKAGKYGDKVLEIPSCSMTPESVKIHDDICDALESRAYNEHDVCTASVGIWATLGVCEKLWRDKIKTDGT